MKGIAAALLLLTAPSAPVDNAGVNAVYDRMSAAYAARDRIRLDGIFHSKMVTSSSVANQPPVIGGRALADRVGAGLDRLKESNRQAELSFRIIHRSWVGETAIDVGVLRMRFFGGDREDRTVYSRFLSSLTKRDDGQWVFLTDAPTSASEADWAKATRFEGARFDP